MRSDEVRPGSVGRPLGGVEVRLVDEFTGHLEGDDPGEIQVRGPNLFSGYWPDGADGPDEDGWWLTGDVGYRDPDGDLYLVDRVRDMVVVSGFNVYPSEVEDVITEVEGVTGAAVIGVEDENLLTKPWAYIVLKDGGLGSDALADELKAHVKSLLMPHKYPRRIVFVAELPKTATGKIQRFKLRERAAEEQGARAA